MDGLCCGFSETLRGRIQGPSSLSSCSCQYPPEVSHCSGKRITVSAGKGLAFITSNVFLLLKYDGNYN